MKLQHQGDRKAHMLRGKAENPKANIIICEFIIYRVTTTARIKLNRGLQWRWEVTENLPEMPNATVIPNDPVCVNITPRICSKKP